MNLREIIILIISSIILPALYTKLNNFFTPIFRAKKWRMTQIELKLLPNLDKQGKRFELLSSPYFIKLHGYNEGVPERYLLVERFINEIFKKKNKDNKRYIILGGSGMGKSIFSMSLFKQYINKYNERSIPFPIHILYLGKDDVIDSIKRISYNNPDSVKSILILDALDENNEAINNTSSFMKELNLVTDVFKFVIITSRNQLFDKRYINIDVPQPTLEELGYEAIYISPFDKTDIQTYLENKYDVGTKEYIKAKQISEDASDIMYRPMLLSFIDDLLKLDSTKITSITIIYYEIVYKWIERECKVNHAKKNNITISDLFTFSKKLAVFIYETGKLEITYNEYDNFIADSDYKENPYSFEGRSLINKKDDDDRTIEFAHKSFLEFFIAIDILENPGKSYNSREMDMAETFVQELCEMYLKGHKLDFINYYTPKNIHANLDSSQIISLLDKIQDEQEPCIDEDSKKNKKLYFVQAVYCLWKVIISKKNAIYQSSNDITNKMLIYECNVYNRLLCGIMNFYCGKMDVSTLRKFAKIGHEFFSCLDNPISKYNEQYDLFYNKRPILMFPNFYNIYDINSDFLTEIPIIGSGFCDDESIYNLIETLLNEKKVLYAINVVKQYNSIDGIISFINELMERIKKRYEGKLSTDIIMEFTINDKTITYLCNEHSIKFTNEQVLKCITNMFRIATCIEFDT